MKNFQTCFLAIALTAGLAISCSNNDAQRDFEEEAYRAPVNITETNNSGSVLSADSDDWRSGPLFQGIIDIRPPFPNPVDVSSTLNFEVEVTGVQSVSGLEVAVRFSNGSFRSIYFDQQTPLPPGITAFQINPIELGQFGSVESARGLHRLYIFDRNGRLISYGDVRVE